MSSGSIGDSSIVFQVDRSQVDTFLAELRNGYVFPVTPQVAAQGAAPPVVPAGTFGGLTTLPSGYVPPPAAPSPAYSASPYATPGYAGPSQAGGDASASARQFAAAVGTFTATVQQLPAMLTAPIQAGSGFVYTGGSGAPSYRSTVSSFAAPRGSGSQAMGAPVEKSSKNKGRRGGSLGSFGRLVRGYFEAREVERLAEAEIKYKQEYSNAGTDEDRYKAEQGLQRSVYSAPLVGPVLHALTMFDLPGVKGMLGTEQTMASAQQEAQHTAMLQQQMVFQQDLSRQAGIAQAGGGTDEARRLEIDAENERQQRADKEQINTREKEIAEENQRRESALNAGKRTDLEKAKDRQASDDPDDPDPGYAQDVADLQKQVDDAEAEIQRDKKRAEDAKTAEEKQLAENARKIYEGHKADLDYQIQSSYRRAGEQRDVDLLERGPEIPGQPGLYRSQPDTARARSTYNAGEDQALDLEHQGRGAQAREVLEGTLARLQKRQFDLLYGGHAEGVDNPLAIDFGQAGVSGQASFHEGDDTAAAIAETNRLIATLIEEIQKLPDKI